MVATTDQQHGKGLNIEGSDIVQLGQTGIHVGNLTDIEVANGSNIDQLRVVVPKAFQALRRLC